MIVAGIDIGSKTSACVWYDGERNLVARVEECDNATMLRHIRADGESCFVVEKPQSWGRAVNKGLMETAFVAGRFAEASGNPQTLERKQVVMHLCGNRTGGDKQVRQAVMFRWGTDPKVVFGKPSAKGPLFFITGHRMAALAVAITYFERWKFSQRLTKEA